MLKTSIKLLIPLSVCMCVVFLSSFSKFNSKCPTVKNGTFHFYPKTKQTHYIIRRKDTLQTEIDLSAGDTTYWRINWIAECEFTCRFMSSTKLLSKEELDFCNNSTLKFTVSNVSKDYYTYDALFSYNNNSTSFSDTMWFHAK